MTEGEQGVEEPTGERRHVLLWKFARHRRLPVAEAILRNGGGSVFGGPRPEAKPGLNRSRRMAGARGMRRAQHAPRHTEILSRAKLPARRERAWASRARAGPRCSPGHQERPDDRGIFERCDEHLTDRWRLSGAGGRRVGALHGRTVEGATSNGGGGARNESAMRGP